MKNPIVKRKVAGSIIKAAAKKQAAKAAKQAKQKHAAWLKNKKPKVKDFNPNKPWVINKDGKATNKIPRGATSRKPMGKVDNVVPVIPKPSPNLLRTDAAWGKKIAAETKRRNARQAVKKTTPPPPSQLPAVQRSRAVVPPRAGAVAAAKPSARLPAVRSSVKTPAAKPSGPIPPLSLKRGKSGASGAGRTAAAAVGTGVAGEAYLRRQRGDKDLDRIAAMLKKEKEAAGKPVPSAKPAPPKKPASKIKDSKAIDAVDRMIEDRGRDALRVARQDPETGDAKAAEKVAKSMKGKDPDWMDKFLGSMGIKKIKGPKKEWEAGPRTYQIGGKGGKTFDVDSTPYEETLTDQEREELEAYKKGGKIGKKKKKVGKKKQGYKARKDESIAMRVKKKRTKKKLKASRDESYGKWGSKKGKGKINRSSGSALVASSYD